MTLFMLGLSVGFTFGSGAASLLLLRLGR